MEEIKYPIREALKAFKWNQADLAEKLHRTRQTISNYIRDYEMCGAVGDRDAQIEFDRIVAEYRQQQNEKRKKTRMEIHNDELEMVNAELKSIWIDYRELLCELMREHPDVHVSYLDGETYRNIEVSIEVLKKEQGYILSRELIEPFIDQGCLSSKQKERWDVIDQRMNDIFPISIKRQLGLTTAYVAEDLWDATVVDGKPVVHDSILFTKYNQFDDDSELVTDCDSFCLCHTGMARIYVDGLQRRARAIRSDNPKSDFDYRQYRITSAYATVAVITDESLYELCRANLDLTEHDLMVGEIRDLIPGYKYAYSITINGYLGYNEKQQQSDDPTFCCESEWLPLK